MSTARKKLKEHRSSILISTPDLKDHPADFKRYRNGEFREFPIEAIKPNPGQPRKYFNETALKELSESIKSKGILQPIVVQFDLDNNAILVAGERRYRASLMAGLKTIPGIVTTGDPDEIALIENIQREDLKPIEEAEGYARLMKKHDYTQEQLAKVVGKGRTTITETLSLNNLPDKLKKECLRVDIPKRVLIEIARKKSAAKMVELFEQYSTGFTDNISKTTKTKQPRKRVVRSKAMIAAARAVSLFDFLSKINLADENDTEKMELLKELSRLKNRIDQILN
jgi:ParB family chromosome partitioning protein